ncbi:MAG: hypothetical protein WDA16_03905 [Candidatus Thermoplasmatota archaeon]
MKHALFALVIAALVLLPSAVAVPQVPAFPGEMNALARKWQAEALALGANDTAREWYPQAEGFLKNATTALGQGRVRTAMYDIETFTEIVLTGQLMDQAASLGSDAEKRSFVIERTAAWNQQARADWQDYRAKLKATEGDIHALNAMELALYSADQALSAAMQTTGHDQLARDFPKTSGFQRDYVLALVRTDHTSILDLQWATDILDAVAQREGLPPRLDSKNWSIMANVALADPGYGDRIPNQLQALEEFGKDVRAHNESTMALVISLAEQRASRATSIEVIFGDARSRGLDVVHDAARGMNLQLNNTTLETATKYGLLGVFTADAIDRAVFTDEFVDRGQAQLSFIIAAWSGLDHQAYATQTLIAASTVVPPPTPEAKKPTPMGVELAVVALAGLALSIRRR